MQFQELKKIGLAVVCVLALNAYALPSGFHTFHTSLTRIDYVEKDRLAQITIQLFSHDLVPVLERKSKKRIDLDVKSPENDKIIADYLSSQFVLLGIDDKPKPFNWVGKETDVDMIYIYLEISELENFDNLKLRNTIFFEDFPEQTNLVIARFNGKKTDLVFKTGDKIKDLSVVKK